MHFRAECCLLYIRQMIHTFSPHSPIFVYAYARVCLRAYAHGCALTCACANDISNHFAKAHILRKWPMISTLWLL